MKDYVIIVAGGSGSRMQAAMPKQFLELNGKPILLHTLEKFHRFNPRLELIVVMHADYVQFWDELHRTLGSPIPHRIIAGGKERFHSVKNGLEAIESTEGIVAIHDAVRPLVSLKTLEACFNVARSKSCAVPVIPIPDSIRQMDQNGSTPVDRSKYRIVQTPQCFEISSLRRAFEQPYRDQFTDDATVYQLSGETLHFVEGNRENIKITTPEDMRMAAALLAES